MSEQQIRYLTLSEVLQQFAQMHGQDWIKDGYYSILTQLLTNQVIAAGGLVGGDLTVEFKRGVANTRFLCISRDSKVRLRLELGVHADPKQEPTVRIIQTASDLYREAARTFKNLGLTRLEADDFRRPFNVYGGHEDVGQPDLGGIH